MKVIHILVELKFSGAEMMYVDAANVFKNKGCELTVMATAQNIGEYAPYFERAGYKVIHWPFPRLKNYLARIRFYKNFYSFIVKEGYDVVHIHSLWAMWGLSLCARLAKKHSVFTFHNVYPSKALTHPYYIALRWTAKYLFNCKFHTISDSVYNHELGYYYNKTVKIYNWYGFDRFYPAEEHEKVTTREQLGIKPNDFVLISVGGCSNIKRHSEIIKALKIVEETIPNFLYLHLGTGTAEEEEMELAKKLGLYDKIKFCGNQHEVRKFLIASDVYLMPSRFEGIPITTIEAMACEIPAILYDVPGLRDFNSQGVNSILIPEDYKILADKIVYVYNNRADAHELASRGRHFVNEHFNMISNAAKIFDLYH